MIIVGIIVLPGCNHYYKATQLSTPDNLTKAISLDSLNNEKRYFILRNGEKAYFMRNARIDFETKSVVSLLQNPGVDHRLHLVNGRNGELKYDTKIPHDLHVLNEVHFYIMPDANITAGPNNLDLNSIQKIEIIEKDKKRTTNSTVMGVVIGLAGVSGLVVMFFLSLFR